MCMPVYLLEACAGRQSEDNFSNRPSQQHKDNYFSRQDREQKLMGRTVKKKKSSVKGQNLADKI